MKSNIRFISFLIYLLITLAIAHENVEICDKNGYCYPKVFVPTNEFTEVLEGQEIPSGLHIKIDFSTGKKYAKLLDQNDPRSEVVLIDEEGSIHQDSHLNLVDSGTHESLENNPKVNIYYKDSVNFNNNTLPIISSKPSKHISHSDHILFDSYVSQLTQSSQSLKIIISVLDGLEDLVHELDFGIKLARGHGLTFIVALLGHGSGEVRKKAALVIGTAMQNNPLAQGEALRMNLIPQFLDSLSEEQDIKVSSRLLYALSSIVRGNRRAIQTVNSYQGLSRLATLYQKFENNEFRAKCALFVTDFIDPNMVKADQPMEIYEQGKEQQRYGSDTVKSLFLNVMEFWCKLFQTTLSDKSTKSAEIDFDTGEKILRGISMIKNHYPLQCPVQDGFKIWLSEQIDAMKDEDYLEDYIRLLQQVQVQYGLS
ncbi:1151_t:CDS:2 [Acaulospora colombiana]|uniref:1151_t:CDS:1 n=1 Tax=Acaulospora colombiana TaxID=27376 RepID=A0ACA9LSY5_9GLOM|nr:1151_t:CDS:2 [Acaulospora colombiana]